MNTGPTEEELLGYFGRLRNWGRWGAGDSKGTVNYITDAGRAEAAALIRTGRAGLKPLMEMDEALF